VLSEAEASAQVELESGKRVKVKGANILLKFEKPQPGRADRRGAHARRTSTSTWPGNSRRRRIRLRRPGRRVFQRQALARPAGRRAVRLFEAPHYFRRAGKGRFRKAPAEIVQQALAAIEKKKQVQAQIAAWAGGTGRGQLPAADPRAAVQDPVQARQERPRIQGRGRGLARHARAPLDLLQRAGAIDSPYQFHWKRFLFENFPKGTGFPAARGAGHQGRTCPSPPVQAFSIDDSQHHRDRRRALGAGPGHGHRHGRRAHRGAGPGAQPGSPSTVARARLSTVYMPGYKITMLPDDVVQAYTLQEGATARPCRSTRASTKPRWSARHRDRLERVPIVANLRHDQLDASSRSLARRRRGASRRRARAAARLRAPLSFLFRLAKHLKAQREVVRGKPENFNRPDYNFRLVGNDGNEPPATSRWRSHARSAARRWT
jgi:exoribonuclease-2